MGACIIDTRSNNHMTTSTIKVYGTTWCGDCKRAVRVLNERKAAYDYINIEQDEAALAYVVQVNNGSHSVPTILFPDGSVMVEPSSAALAAKLESLGSTN